MKYLLSIFFSLVLVLSCFGQITLGPRLGLNFSKQSLDSPYETWKTGTVFGGVVNLPIKNELSFQGEFLFSQKGYREEFDGDNSYDELTSKYWEVPLLINYMYSAGQVNFFGNAGAYLAYWKSGSYESKIGENDVLVEDYEFTSTPDEDGFSDNRFDYGVAVGAGVLYDRVGTAGNIILEFRYSQGFAPVSTVENPPADYTAGKNKTFSISLAYMLYL
jgi:hypothetical protein